VRAHAAGRNLSRETRGRVAVPNTIPPTGRPTGPELERKSPDPPPVRRQPARICCIPARPRPPIWMGSDGRDRSLLPWRDGGALARRVCLSSTAIRTGTGGRWNFLCGMEIVDKREGGSLRFNGRWVRAGGRWVVVGRCTYGTGRPGHYSDPMSTVDNKQRAPGWMVACFPSFIEAQLDTCPQASAVSIRRSPHYDISP
jgi:hypothetical protein